MTLFRISNVVICPRSCVCFGFALNLWVIMLDVCQIFSVIVVANCTGSRISKC